MDSVTPYMYGNHLHYVDMPPCLICEKENAAYGSLLKELGAYELERRIRRLKSTRLYERRWPFDGTTKAVPIEDMEIAVEFDPLGVMIADEAVDEFLADLTDKQLEVTDLSVKGYKPREIAEMLGAGDSGAVRWHKFVVKQKLARKKKKN